MRKLILSVALCAAFATSALASAPDEDTSSSATSTPAVAWTPQVTEKAKEDNKDNPFLLLHQLPYQMIFTNLFAVGGTEELTTLLTSCHKLHDQLSHIGVRTAFREVLKAHPEAGKLDPWAEMLFHKDAKVQHLIWARQMLRPEHIKRLGMNNLLGQLTLMLDKAKALALAAHAPEIFTEDMDCWNQVCIIEAALDSSHPFSYYATLASACKAHLFTEKMDGLNRGTIIEAALYSSRPLSEFAALRAACKEHLFTEGMNGHIQEVIIHAALQSSRPFSDYATLASACKAHLFTEGMDKGNQASIIQAALYSSRPLSEFAALGAACKEHLFMETMNGNDLALIIRTALKSSRPLSEYAALGAACKEHLFTEKMEGYALHMIIAAALKSSRPLSEYAALGAAFKVHLFTEDMNGLDQAAIMEAALPLSDIQIARLVTECGEITGDNLWNRYNFIQERAKELLAEGVQ